jgi:hypothetical protein
MTPSIVAPRPAGRLRAIARLIALLPLWLLVLTAVASNDFVVVFSRPPDVAGLPLGVVLETIAVLWTLGGLAIVWRARSPIAESLALILFTIPATVVVGVTPAAIEIMQSLA